MVMKLFGNRRQPLGVIDLDARRIRERIRTLETEVETKQAIINSQQATLDSLNSLLGDQRAIIIRQKDTLELLLARAEAAEQQEAMLRSQLPVPAVIIDAKDVDPKLLAAIRDQSEEMKGATS